jgi:hypothetical protein
LYAGWDAHCPGLVAAREREAKWKSEEEQWTTAPMSSDAGRDIREDDLCCQWWLASDAKLMTTLHAMSCGWPSVEGGIEVSVEVRSVLSDSGEERPVKGHLSVSLPPLSSPTFPMFICILPTPLYHL